MKDRGMAGISKWKWSFENEYDDEDNTSKYGQSEESTEEGSILNFNQFAASDGETRMKEESLSELESRDPGFFENTIDVNGGEPNDCNSFGELKRGNVAHEMNPDCVEYTAEIRRCHSNNTDEATRVCGGGNSLMAADEVASTSF